MRLSPRRNVPAEHFKAPCCGRMLRKSRLSRYAKNTAKDVYIRQKSRQLILSGLFLCILLFYNHLTENLSVLFLLSGLVVPRRGSTRGWLTPSAGFDCFRGMFILCCGILRKEGKYRLFVVVQVVAVELPVFHNCAFNHYASVFVIFAVKGVHKLVVCVAFGLYQLFCIVVVVLV